MSTSVNGQYLLNLFLQHIVSDLVNLLPVIMLIGHIRKPMTWGACQIFTWIVTYKGTLTQMLHPMVGLDCMCPNVNPMTQWNGKWPWKERHTQKPMTWGACQIFTWIVTDKGTLTQMLSTQALHPMVGLEYVSTCESYDPVEQEMTLKGKTSSMIMYLYKWC